MNKKLIKKLNKLDTEITIWIEYIELFNGIFKPNGDGAKECATEEFKEVTIDLIKQIKSIEQSVIRFVYKE